VILKSRSCRNTSVVNLKGVMQIACFVTQKGIGLDHDGTIFFEPGVCHPDTDDCLEKEHSAVPRIKVSKQRHTLLQENSVASKYLIRSRRDSMATE